jgi:RNA polymerase sigma factor (TIGR02999 family)
MTDGDPNGKADPTFDEIYAQLRAIARAHMASERAGHTLQATALVHEVWARLAASDAERWASPKVFASLAAQAMRRVLIDHARSRGAVKRGGGEAKRFPLEIDEAMDLARSPDPEAIIRFDEVLERLAAVDERAAEVVRLRFYAGLSAEETAEAMETSLSSVNRDWQFARAWLKRELGREA